MLSARLHAMSWLSVCTCISGPNAYETFLVQRWLACRRFRCVDSHSCQQPDCATNVYCVQLSFCTATAVLPRHVFLGKIVMAVAVWHRLLSMCKEVAAGGASVAPL